MHPHDELFSTDTDTHCPRCDSTELAPEREGDVCIVCQRQEND